MSLRYPFDRPLGRQPYRRRVRAQRYVTSSDHRLYIAQFNTSLLEISNIRLPVNNVAAADVPSKMFYSQGIWHVAKYIPCVWSKLNQKSMRIILLLLGSKHLRFSLSFLLPTPRQLFFSITIHSLQRSDPVHPPPIQWYRGLLPQG
jgi:hypothetical protein